MKLYSKFKHSHVRKCTWIFCLNSPPFWSVLNVFIWCKAMHNTWLMQICGKVLIGASFGKVNMKGVKHWGCALTHQHGGVIFTNAETMVLFISWPFPTFPVFNSFPLDKMATISQTIFSDAFSWMKSFVFWEVCYWNLFVRVESTIFQHWFR